MGGASRCGMRIRAVNRGNDDESHNVDGRPRSDRCLDADIPCIAVIPPAWYLLAKLLAIVTGNRPRIVTREIDGVKFELDLRETIGASLYYSGSFEPEAEATIAAVPTPGMTAVDIGANFGYHTFRIGKAVGRHGKVVAIEPTAWVYDKLQRNIALNDLANIHPLKVALGDCDQGPTELRIEFSFRLDGTDQSMNETVPLYTLDTVMKAHGVERVDFVKMDVDGFEGKVIRGAHETLTKYRPILFFEITPSAMRANGDDPADLIRTLTSLAYNLLTEARRPIPDIARYLAKAPGGRPVNLLASHLFGPALQRHRPTRRRGRQMQKFKSPRLVQRFLSAHGMIYGRHDLRSFPAPAASDERRPLPSGPRQNVPGLATGDVRPTERRILSAPHSPRLKAAFIG